LKDLVRKPFPLLAETVLTQRFSDFFLSIEVSLLAIVFDFDQPSLVKLAPPMQPAAPAPV
jgi:hypothetical protein